MLFLWKSGGKTTVNRGKRTGKRRLSAKSQPLRGRILLRADTNTQEGDYPFSSASKAAGGLAVPRFDLQPFSRGVDLPSWTRHRAVPGGGAGCRGTVRQGRSGRSPSQTCCTQADAIMTPVPSICRYICRYISSDSERSLANTGVVDSCASATIPFYPGVTSSASSISSPSSLDGGVMSFAIFARSPSQCPMKAASSSGVISARFLS